MNKLFLLPVILMACVCMLASCEKENVAEIVESNATSNLKPANFLLIQKGYVDENGFVGDLYYNESDPKCRCLVLSEQQTRGPQPTWTGKVEPVYATDDDGNLFVWTYICDETKSPKNCRNTTGGGFISNEPVGK